MCVVCVLCVCCVCVHVSTCGSVTCVLMGVNVCVCVCMCVCGVVNLQEQQNSSTVRDGAPFNWKSMSGVAKHSTGYSNHIDHPDEQHHGEQSCCCPIPASTTGSNVIHDLDLTAESHVCDLNHTT